MLEPNLADRTKGDVSNPDASAATGLSLAFYHPGDSPNCEQRVLAGPAGNSRDEGGEAAASCRGLCRAPFARGGDSPRTDLSLSMQLQWEFYAVREHRLSPER